MKEKKMVILAMAGLTVTLGVGVMKGFSSSTVNKSESDDFLLENVEALSEQGEDTGEYPRYVNDSWRRSYVETKASTHKDSTGTAYEISFKRNCSSVITSCKSTRDDKDICYGSLNGVVTDCGSWTKE